MAGVGDGFAECGAGGEGCATCDPKCFNRSGWMEDDGDGAAGVVGTELVATGIRSNCPEAVRLEWRPEEGPVGGCFSGVGGRGISVGPLASRREEFRFLGVFLSRGPEGMSCVVAFKRPKLGSACCREFVFRRP